MENFFIFDPTRGQEETEERKILYYYPSTTPIYKQCTFVGLAEGLTGFTR
jgi:hypothetical protein